MNIKPLTKVNHLAGFFLGEGGLHWIGIILENQINQPFELLPRYDPFIFSEIREDPLYGRSGMLSPLDPPSPIFSQEGGKGTIRSLTNVVKTFRKEWCFTSYRDDC